MCNIKFYFQIQQYRQSEDLLALLPKVNIASTRKAVAESQPTSTLIGPYSDFRKKTFFNAL